MGRGRQGESARIRNDGTKSVKEAVNRRRLAKIYYDPEHPAGYSGSARVLAAAAGLPVREVRLWLSGQPAYTKYKAARRTFRRNPVFVQGVDLQLDVDLVSVIPLAPYNSGFRYLLTAVDVLSKRAHVTPIKNKSGPVVARALDKILSTTGVRAIRTDLGREFLNSHVRRVLKDRDVLHIKAYNSTKASLVERFHRTLRARLWRYFEKAGTKKYTDVLQRLVRGYNNSVHSATNMRPSDVNVKNQHLAWNNLYGPMLEQRRLWRARGKKPVRTNDLPVGQLVRLSKAKHAFETGYVPQYTSETFVIHKVIAPVRGLKDHFYRYKIRDMDGEVILGSFYRQELQPIREESS